MHSAAQSLEHLIYRFSSLMLYPALALLVWYSLRVLWALGEAARDGWSIRPSRLRAAGERLRALGAASGQGLADDLRDVRADRDQHPQVRRFAHELEHELARGDRATVGARARHLAARFEADLARDVDRVRVLVRIGPCLGLAATLIPLGPGLAALADGDLERLSAQLIVAFSATVIGLGIGGIGYVLAVARAHTADLAGADIELLCELAAVDAGETGSVPASPLDLPGPEYEASGELAP